MNYACRLCRHSIATSEGCDVCKPFKVHLIALDEHDEDRPSLSEVANESVATLRLMIRKARDLLKDGNVKKWDRGADLAIKAGNTAAKVLDSARKLQTDGVEAVKLMSFLERAELFIGWYVALPPSHRMRVREEMDKMEGLAARKLEIADGER